MLLKSHISISPFFFFPESGWQANINQNIRPVVLYKWFLNSNPKHMFLQSIRTETNSSICQFICLKWWKPKYSAIKHLSADGKTPWCSTGDTSWGLAGGFLASLDLSFLESSQRMEAMHHSELPFNLFLMRACLNHWTRAMRVVRKGVWEFFISLSHTLTMHLNGMFSTDTLACLPDLNTRP